MTLYILMTVMGFMTMWLKTWDSARRKPDYTFRTFVDLNMVKFITGVFFLAALSLSLDYFFGLFHDYDGLQYVVAFFVGLGSSAIFNEFFKVFRGRIKNR